LFLRPLPPPKKKGSGRKCPIYLSIYLSAIGVRRQLRDRILSSADTFGRAALGGDSALAVMASTSGVSKEREAFMDLVKNEIERLNATLAKRGSVSMVFHHGGTTVR
jgi:hypothetical protein